MTRLLILATVLIGSASPALAQEDWTLTTPESQDPGDRTRWRPEEFMLRFERGDNNDINQIEVIFEDNTGNPLRCSYGGDNTSVAHSDQLTFNTLDFSSGISFKSRLMTKMSTRGGPRDTDLNPVACLPAGSVTGTP